MAKKEACPTTGSGRSWLPPMVPAKAPLPFRGIKMAQICGSSLSILSVIETNPEFEALAPGTPSRPKSR